MMLITFTYISLGFFLGNLSGICMSHGQDKVKKALRLSAFTSGLVFMVSIVALHLLALNAHLPAEHRADLVMAGLSFGLIYSVLGMNIPRAKRLVKARNIA
jgi:hypothetical protein